MKRLTFLGLIACLGILLAPAAVLGVKPAEVVTGKDWLQVTGSFTVNTGEPQIPATVVDIPEGKRLIVTHVSVSVHGYGFVTSGMHVLFTGEFMGQAINPVASGVVNRQSNAAFGGYVSYAMSAAVGLVFDFHPYGMPWPELTALVLVDFPVEAEPGGTVEVECVITGYLVESPYVPPPTP